MPKRLLSRSFSFAKKSVLIVVLIITLVFSGFEVWAKTAFALTDIEQEAEWRAELQQTEADIAKWQSILDSTKANTKSLQQEAALLNAKIQQAKAFIK